MGSMDSTKVCTKCEKAKTQECFPKDKTRADGLFSWCKDCKSLKRKEDRVNNLEKIRQKDRERYYKDKEKISKRHKVYVDKNKEKISLKQKEWRENNKELKKELDKKYREENKEKLHAQTKEWAKNNRKYLNEHINNYNKKRRQSDPIFKMISNLRSRLHGSLKSKKWKKNTKFAKYIGCSLDELKEYFENLFLPNMSWGNQGEWHIDHIVPLASAKTEEELFKLCHYTNLQPLWAINNLKKGDRMPKYKTMT